MDTIPEDILVEIFQRIISEKALLNCAVVSSKWNAVIRNKKYEYLIWKSACLRKWKVGKNSLELGIVEGWQEVFRSSSLIQEAMARIQDGDSVLYLNKLALTAIPSQLFDLSELLYLDLSRNGLNILPSKFTNLQHLKTLYLSHNKFQLFPDVLLSMIQLESIDLNYNMITEVPHRLTYLSNLTVLRLLDCNLDNLPDFQLLPKLTSLYVSSPLHSKLPNKSRIRT